MNSIVRLVLLFSYEEFRIHFNNRYSNDYLNLNLKLNSQVAVYHCCLFVAFKLALCQHYISVYIYESQ